MVAASLHKIRAELDVVRSCDIVMREKACFKESLVSFVPTSGEEIHKIVSRLTKTCELDPLPSKQCQQCLPSLVPVISVITNKSLAEGTDVFEGGSCSSAAEEAIVGRATELQAC